MENELIKIGREQISELQKKDKYSYIQSIHDDLQYLKDNFNDIMPDELSMLGVRIATNNINLGGLVSQLSLIYNESKNYNLTLEAELETTLTDLVGRRKTMEIRLRMKATKDIELVNKFVYQYFKNVRDDVDRMCSLIQTRIRVLEGERRGL